MTVRQRNPGPHAVSVPTLSAEVQPGETVDWPDPIAGFEAVADDSAPDTAPADPAVGDADAPAAGPPSSTPPASPRRGGAKNKGTDPVAETPKEA